MKKFFRNIGPGTLVAAAFIGPGTVTVCTLAGVKYDFTLLWAMVLSIVATIVLQEMAARLGLIYQKGLAETVRITIKWHWLRLLAVGLILSAVLVGNAAYEAGNISGGVLGLQTIVVHSTLELGSIQFNYLGLLIGGIAFLLLYIGNYKLIEKSLISLVVFMSISFVITAIITNPPIVDVFKGMFMPKIPEKGWLTVVALVGTTVVPYNLFLHASLVKEKWKDPSKLKAAKRDTYISIVLGGLVSMAIIICAAAIDATNITNASDLAAGLEPLYGSFSKYFLSMGLFAAGITSAITAPLAAAYVAKECFDWGDGLKSAKFRTVWMFILVLGIVISSMGWKPIEIIQFAQVANGLLLPIIAMFLLWVVNKEEVLGVHKNTVGQNIFGIIIVVTTIILGMRSLEKVFGFSVL